MIDVAIVDDDRQFCSEVREILQEAEGISSVYVFHSCRALLKRVQEILPDVILMDIELSESDINGCECVARVKQMVPDIEILMLTIHGDDEAVFNSLRCGANGYLVKSVSSEKLIAAIQEIYKGGSPMSMQIARKVTEFFHTQPPQEPLTHREQEILRMLCEGKSDKEIANKLFIEVTTVKFHNRNIYRKLQVPGRPGAIAKAMRDGLV
ncbi:MAG: DNA-binding response regulator [Methanobacteriota archaeon]|nr:MAG: DNA-binding response regulator [Euryarchaeota archaeon]